VHEDLIEIHDAFWVLSSSRQFHVAMNGRKIHQPIAISEIVVYGKLIGYSDLHLFINLIQAMDSEFLIWTSQK
jgi:hypothetical protein